MPKSNGRTPMFIDLLPHLYEAAIGERPWTDLAQAVARAHGSSSTTLQVVENGRHSNILDATPNVREFLPSYIENFAQQDIWVNRALERIGPGTVGASKDLVSDREFERSAFYQDWCRRMDLFYVLGAVLPVGPDALGVLGIHRSRRAGTYEETDKALAQQFLPHLRSALQVHNRLREAQLLRTASLQVLESSGKAVLVLGRNLNVLFASPQAERLLRRSPSLQVRAGILSARSAGEAARLTQAVRSASDAPWMGGRPSLSLTFDAGTDHALALSIAPFPRPRAGEPPACAVVFLSEAAPPRSPTQILRSLYQLTPTEARLAQELVQGRSLAEIARAHGKSVQTVRKQVKSILAKTGTHRQAQCVATLLRSLAAAPC